MSYFDERSSGGCGARAETSVPLQAIIGGVSQYGGGFSFVSRPAKHPTSTKNGADGDGWDNPSFGERLAVAAAAPPSFRFEKTEMFPHRLFVMLEYTTLNPEWHAAASWSPDGRSFWITDEYKLVQLLPRFVKTDKFRSFTRQLSLYGFNRCFPLENAWRHKHFMRQNGIQCTRHMERKRRRKGGRVSRYEPPLGQPEPLMGVVPGDLLPSSGVPNGDERASSNNVAEMGVLNPKAEAKMDEQQAPPTSKPARPEASCILPSAAVGKCELLPLLQHQPPHPKMKQDTQVGVGAGDGLSLAKAEAEMEVGKLLDASKMPGPHVPDTIPLPGERPILGGSPQKLSISHQQRSDVVNPKNMPSTAANNDLASTLNKILYEELVELGLIPCNLPASLGISGNQPVDVDVANAIVEYLGNGLLSLEKKGGLPSSRAVGGEKGSDKVGRGA